MADQDLDQMLRRMAQTKVSRRGFLWASGLSASAAVLAACGPGSSPSASSAATTAPSVSAGTGGSASASPSAAAVEVEKELFMYNWGDYVDPDNMKAFQEQFGVEKFTYDTYASNEEMMTKLQGGAKG